MVHPIEVIECPCSAAGAIHALLLAAACITTAWGCEPSPSTPHAIQAAALRPRPALQVPAMPSNLKRVRVIGCYVGSLMLQTLNEAIQRLVIARQVWGSDGIVGRGSSKHQHHD